jgi:hypothetical protein
MTMTSRCALLLVLSMLALAAGSFQSVEAALADGCNEHPGFGNISGSRDTAILSGTGARNCNSGVAVTSIQLPQPYYTHQIV